MAMNVDLPYQTPKKQSNDFWPMGPWWIRISCGMLGSAWPVVVRSIPLRDGFALFALSFFPKG
jgi:hypothetical protein